MPSSRTPTTCARHRASCSPPACRARVPRWSPTTRWRPRRRGPASRDRVRGLRPGGTRWCRRCRLGHRVAGVRPARLGRGGERMARPLLIDGRNFLDAKLLEVGRLRVRRHRQGGRGGRVGALQLVQAIVLVGGEGTRLRPLTQTVPKPALTLVDRPFLAYMIEWLASHGVTEVVLACGFLPDVLREALAGEEERAGVAIRYVVEPERCGTAGAIRYAADELGEDLDERFLVLNGDVLTDLDLTALLRRTRRRRRGRRSRCTRSRILRLRPGQHRGRRRGARVRSRRPARRLPERSTPGCTCSSARCST